jgi:hypothetical protein
VLEPEIEEEPLYRGKSPRENTSAHNNNEEDVEPLHLTWKQRDLLAL